MNLKQLQHLFTVKVCSDSKIYNLRSLQVLPVSHIYTFPLNYLFKKNGITLNCGMVTWIKRHEVTVSRPHCSSLLVLIQTVLFYFIRVANKKSHFSSLSELRMHPSHSVDVRHVYSCCRVMEAQTEWWRCSESTRRRTKPTRTWSLWQPPSSSICSSLSGTWER